MCQRWGNGDTVLLLYNELQYDRLGYVIAVSHEYLMHRNLTRTVKITFANNPQFSAFYLINCKTSSLSFTDALSCKLQAIEINMAWTCIRH